MTAKATLEIDPNKWSERKGHIQGDISDNWRFSPCVQYGYIPNTTSVELFKITFDGKPLDDFAGPIKRVTRVFTYFKDDYLLLIEIQAGDKYYYYASEDTNSKVDKNTKLKRLFAEYPGLDKDSLRALLSVIRQNRKFVYDSLPDDVKNKLWRLSDIMFDLGQLPKGTNETKYHSDVSGTEVTVSFFNWEDYILVKHIPTGSLFHIKGIKDVLKKGKNGQLERIEVNGGFPVELCISFIYYYKNGKPDDPLLVTFIVSATAGITTYVANYYLSKNETTGKWDKLALGNIGGSEENEYLPKILKYIEENKKLEVSKLGSGLDKKLRDVTKDLVIMINLEFKEGENEYESDSRKIPYEKKTSNDYSVVTHAHKLPNFTVKEIRMSGEIDRSLLPATDVPVSKLKVYYNGKATTNPLLIYFLYTSRKTKWLQRYYGDKRWTELNTGAPASENDPKIRSLVKKLAVPNVQIDISKPHGQTYTPTGTDLTFRVTESQVVGSSNFFSLSYSRTEKGTSNQPFRIKGLYCKGQQLKDLSPRDVLICIAVYFHGGDPSPDNIVMVELENEGATGEKYKYYMKRSVDGKWASFHRSNDRLSNTELLSKLNGITNKELPDPPEEIEVEETESPSTLSTTSTSLSAGVIAGIVVGSVVGACVCGIIGWKLTPVIKSYIVKKNSLL